MKLIKQVWDRQTLSRSTPPSDTKSTVYKSTAKARRDVPLIIQPRWRSYSLLWIEN